MTQENQNILVGLDMSFIDDAVLSFIQKNHRALHASVIYFLHVTKEGESDKDSGQHDDMKDKLAKKIDEQMQGAIGKYEVRIEKGDPQDMLRDWSSELEIDLLIVGNKFSGDHDVKVEKLVKKPTRSLLLIPEKKDYGIERIGVPIDFSDLSKIAVEESLRFGEITSAQLIGFHSYQVPSGYHKSGMDHEEFAEVMEGNAKKEAEKFFEDIDHDQQFRMEYYYDRKEEPADSIAQFAKKNDLDLLVLGSKGRTGAASVILGSVAKKITKIINDRPILILKEKGKNMDLLDALKKV